MKVLAASILPLFFPGFANAATIVYYDIPTSGTTNTPTSGDNLAGASSISKGTGQFTVSPSSGTAYLLSSSSSNTLSGSISGQDFLEFSVNVGVGQTMSLSGITLDIHSETGGNAYVALFLSLTPFSTAPTSGNETGTVGTNSSTYTAETIGITDSAYQNLSDATVYFRLYGYQDVTDQGGQYLRAQDITVSGTFVPEPNTSLLGLLATAPFLMRRRRG